ncbi:MAG TPA: DUF4395 domain-containing protein [Bacteroidetes bacterium]|nr:DUF4395 domain-containing protein [Bacteroidota bacterium]
MAVSKSCPIEYKTVDKNIIRVNAMIVFSFLLLFIITFNPMFLMMIAMDYIIRVFIDIKYSPICFVIKRILKLSGVKPHRINAGPKSFAAKIGFIFTTMISIAFILGFNVTALVISAIFLIATGMDAFLNYCIACQIYPFYKKIVG